MVRMALNAHEWRAMLAYPLTSKTTPGADYRQPRQHSYGHK